MGATNISKLSWTTHWMIQTKRTTGDKNLVRAVELKKWYQPVAPLAVEFHAFTTLFELAAFTFSNDLPGHDFFFIFRPHLSIHSPDDDGGGD